jgi:nucleoside-diphosphate-sugar epimerase
MRILIIGGTGLISTYITHLLTERGRDQIVLYNRGKSIYDTPPGVKTVKGDRCNYPAFENQMRDLGIFDVVIDMIGYQPSDGESVVRAFAGRTGHFIFCSTVDVYLKPASRYPYTEAEGYGGLNDYAAKKVILEKTLLAAHTRGDFPLTIIRPAYTYGEGRGPLETFGGRTLILDRIRRGLPIVVHGDGQSLWVCCHAQDVARTFATAAGADHTFGKCYHTAGEEWLTWNEYYRQIAEALGAPPPNLVHIPTVFLYKVNPARGGLTYTNTQFNNIFDNNAARLDLDFQYTIDWKTGVQRMATWLDAHDAVAKAESDPFDDRLINAWQRLSETIEKEYIA